MRHVQKCGALERGRTVDCEMSIVNQGQDSIHQCPQFDPITIHHIVNDTRKIQKVSVDLCVRAYKLQTQAMCTNGELIHSLVRSKFITGNEALAPVNPTGERTSPNCIARPPPRRGARQQGEHIRAYIIEVSESATFEIEKKKHNVNMVGDAFPPKLRITQIVL